jgi:hypothetical protein
MLGLFRRFDKELAAVPPGKLRVCGEVEPRERDFGVEDLRALPAEFQIPDVGQYKSGFRGRGARLAGLLAVCGPKSGPLYLNAASRDGRKRLALWRMEVEPLALLVYDGGPFQLLLPGFHGPRECIEDLALLEISRTAERERP